MTVTQKQYNAILVTYKFFMIVVTLLVILGQGAFQHKLLETILCITAFLLFKPILPMTLHATSMAACLGVSAVVLTALIRISLTINTSLVCAPIIGLLLAYVACKYAMHLDLDNNRDKELSALKSPPKFNCKTATIEEFKNQCLSLGYNEYHTSRAVDLLSCKRLETIKAASIKHGYSERYMKALKQRYKQQLESK